MNVGTNKKTRLKPSDIKAILYELDAWQRGERGNKHLQLPVIPSTPLGDASRICSATSGSTRRTRRRLSVGHRLGLAEPRRRRPGRSRPEAHPLRERARVPPGGEACRSCTPGTSRAASPTTFVDDGVRASSSRGSSPGLPVPSSAARERPPPRGLPCLGLPLFLALSRSALPASPVWFNTGL